MWNNTEMYLGIGSSQYWVFYGSELSVLSDSVFTVSTDAHTHICWRSTTLADQAYR